MGVPVLALRGVALALLLAGCASEDPAQPDLVADVDWRAWLDSSEVRRAVLEESLVNPDNAYSQLRLSRYGAAWDELPQWNAPARPLLVADLGTFADAYRSSAEGTLAPLAIPEVLDEAALIALGREAFGRYPIEVEMDYAQALGSEDEARDFGLEIDRDGGVGGLVRVALPSGREGFGVTCASCHSRAVDGERVDGLASRVDRGAISAERGASIGAPAAAIAELLSWGPGRVDVTSDARSNPTAMPDLRAVRYQSHLHWAGTVRSSLLALAVRIETLMITSLDRAQRPPRAVPLGIAMYLWSLGARSGEVDRDEDGRAVFETQCASCHREDGTVGMPVPIALVGTDPAVGESPDRTTGAYRVPSLFHVGDRTPLLHDGSVATLDDLLDGDRASPGHRFGTELDDAQRAALLAFVRAL